MARGVAAGRFTRAAAASSYARRTGCGIDEASDAVAAGVTRRQLLGGAGVAVAAGAVPFVPEAIARAASDNRDRRVIIVGSGLAGLGCAYQLWRQHRVRSEIYEYNAERIGGRVHTLRGYFDGGQYAEQHGEFISTEHTALRRLAAGLGLHLDNVNKYPPRTRPLDNLMHFGGKFWPQASLDQEWHHWGRRLFLDAATKAPWPTLHHHYTAAARRWDHMSVPEWIEQNIPGGLKSDFGQLCVSTTLDEYGGELESTSALNLIYLLGGYDSAPSGLQPKAYPELSGTDEKWHLRGGNDQVITGLQDRLPRGTVHLGERLVAVRRHSNGTFTAMFANGRQGRAVKADHVVLALPFTKLREVDLVGISLPPLQLRAINEEPLGSNSKIQLQFTRRVWNEQHWTGTMYNDAIMQSGWETTIDQPGPDGIMIALPGGAVGAGLGHRYGLRTFEGPAPAAMVADFLRCYEENYPGISAAYSGKAYYSWSSGDPHIGGAYSYLKVGQYTGFNGAQSRRHGNLHFAGEQTSGNFQGYMEGALRSGYRCAKEIMSGRL
jgi:monoamine oxidase